MNATCTIDVNHIHTNADPLIASCACNAGFVGNGLECIPTETDTASVTLRYIDSDLYAKVPSQSQQRILLQKIIETAELVANIRFGNRIYGSAIHVYSQTSMAVTFSIAPRTYESQIPVCSASSALETSLIRDEFVTTFNANVEFRPSTYAVTCPTGLATFTSTTTTVTSTTATTVTSTSTTSATVTSITLTSVSSSSTTITQTVDLSAQSGLGDGSDDSWGEDETIFLVAALLVVFTILMVAGMIYAVKQNSRAKLLELGLMFPQPSAMESRETSPAFQNKLEDGPGEDTKWMADPDSPSPHYHPPGSGMGSPTSILG